MRALGAALAAWRREGPRAVLARIGARRDALAWRRRFADQGAWSTAPFVPGVPVLRVLGTPAHGELGGVQRALLARLAVEQPPWALLAPTDRGPLRLEVASGDGRLLAWRLSRGLEATTIRAVAAALGSRLVHLENLAPFDPGALGALREPGGPGLVLGVHDLGAFCSRPHLLEAGVGRYCAASRDAARCAACLAAAAEAPLDLVRWRLESARLLAAARAVVAPSRWLAATLGEALAPELGAVAVAWKVIPPATAGEPLEPRTRGGRVRRIAMVGAFREDKGARVVAAAIAMQAPPPWLALLGPIDPELASLAEALAPRARGLYRPGTLGRRLRQLSIDLVVVPSVVPESHGLVADEAWRAGVPVLAFDRGALGQRIAELGGGLAIPASADPGADAAALGGTLRELLAGRLELPPVPSSDRLPSPQGVARALAELYRELGG